MKNSVGATQEDVGLAFCLIGGFYMVANLVAGFVSYLCPCPLNNSLFIDKFSGNGSQALILRVF